MLDPITLKPIGDRSRRLADHVMLIATLDRNGNPALTLSGASAATAVSASFTRPADTTPYTSGDLVANSATAGSVVPLTLAAVGIAGSSGKIRRVKLSKTDPGVTTASFRVHFFASLPTVTNGDNAAWLPTMSGYLGSADVTVDRAFSDGAAGIASLVAGSEINFATAAGSTSIYALVEARSAYTPASGEVFTVTVEIQQN